MDKKKILKTALKSPYREFFSLVIRFSPLRKTILGVLDKSLSKNYPKSNRYHRPMKVQKDKAAMVSAMLHAVDRGLTEGTISRNVWSKFFKSFSNIYTGNNEKSGSFDHKYGNEPPGFLTISPGAFCNLKCIGCYANSSSESKKKLKYKIVSRIVREQKELWNSHFTVISGGEPLLWQSEDKTIFDLAKEHSDTFFLMYTNGTVINHTVAQKFAEVGNITPAISVEGFEDETDKRRGKGAYKRIIQAFENLRKVGVPYGISVTATRENAETILNEEFFDYYFYKQGALYCWIFQYMPIGRGANFESVVTPEQRLMMYKKTWEFIRERKMFIADFWNCGTVSNGCISAGIHGGYFYIDWNGNVMPCVFNPFYTHNINETYAKGGTLNDVLFSAFFEKIRNWQNRYAYNTSPEQMGNVIVPCAIRDHFDMMYNLIRESGAKGADEQASQAIEDKEYREKLITYGNCVSKVTDDIWHQEYLKPERKRELKN